MNGLSANQPSEGMPLIHCRCGQTILVLPDVKAMNRAIENHIATHKIKSKASAERLRKSLIGELLDIIAAA